MRLLQYDEAGRVSFTKDLSEAELPNYRYAILSHTWGPNEEEVTYDDVLNEIGTSKPGIGSKKIRFCVERARGDGFDYFWVDTCCIDKKNSVEHQEAINSMFNYYKHSKICYAYLVDFGVAPREFGEARWFKRGWTLQELIAPDEVVFFDACGRAIGKKSDPDLGLEISRITGIDESVLFDARELPYVSVANKMSWAARRETTKKEDRAYCLLGIFDVTMPLLYGEPDKAFPKLQEAIMRRTSDHSILCHGGPDVLAKSPEDFADIGIWGDLQRDMQIQARILPCGLRWVDTFEMISTGDGLQVTLLAIEHAQDKYHAILNCRYQDNFQGRIALSIAAERDLRDGRIVGRIHKPPRQQPVYPAKIPGYPEYDLLSDMRQMQAWVPNDRFKVVTEHLPDTAEYHNFLLLREPDDLELQRKNTRYLRETSVWLQPDDAFKEVFWNDDKLRVDTKGNWNHNGLQVDTEGRWNHSTRVLQWIGTRFARPYARFTWSSDQDHLALSIKGESFESLSETEKIMAFQIRSQQPGIQAEQETMVRGIQWHIEASSLQDVRSLEYSDEIYVSTSHGAIVATIRLRYILDALVYIIDLRLNSLSSKEQVSCEPRGNLTAGHKH